MLITRKTGMRALTACVVLSFVGVTNAQPTPGEETVSIHDSRPLARAAEILVRRYGIPISYEDVSAYTYPGDLSERQEVFVTRWGSRVSLTRAGGLELRLPIPRGSVPLPAAAVAGFLVAAAAQHESANNPGRFAVVGTAAGLALVPTANRDRSGIVVPDQSLLEARISFPEMDRDIESALETFDEAVRAATGKTINLRHGFPGLRVRVGANNEVARDVLAKIINGLRRVPGLGTESIDGTLPRPLKYTWTLTSDPSADWPNEPVYSLHLDSVEMDRTVNKIPAKVFIFQCAVPAPDCYNRTGRMRDEDDIHVR